MWRLHSVQDGQYVFQRAFNPFGIYPQPVMQTVTVARDEFWGVTR